MKYPLLFLLALACSANLYAQKAELFVLSIGVETYKDARLNLNYCADDARDVAAALRRQTDLYAVMEVKVVTDAAATRSAVRSELDRMGRLVTGNDLFVLFFSGHGVENGLVPYDFDPKDPYATLLSKDDLKAKLASLGCNYVVLIDACHSGSFAKSALGKNLQEGAFALSVDQASRQLAEALSATDKNSMVISSSSSDQKSWECPTCGHGYFAQTLLDCIEGKSCYDPQLKRTISPQADANGFLGALNLENYMTEAVRIRTADIESPQKVRVLRSTGSDFPILRVKTITPTTNPAQTPRQDQPPPIDADRDGDGRPDKTDACPDDPGSLLGCPDGDHDGIADKDDRCPYEPGTAANNGCPLRDRDNDGTVDDKDQCPDAYGKIDWQGCPDSDGDGIPDHKDKCPAEKGPAANTGCPYVTDKPESYTDPLAGTFIKVKGGTFNMGCTSEQSDCSSDEKPVHPVSLSDYYMGQTEVTQAQWRAVMGSDPAELRFKGCDQCPVERVSWNDIQDFLSRLNARSGNARYRLPTEAEWEYAARGGAQSRGTRYAGSNNIDEVAWYTGNSDSKTHPVKGKKANELGLHDMTGNVWEWCQDWYGDYPSSSQTNPTGPTSGSSRVIRGGPGRYDPTYCRVAYRYVLTPDYRNYSVGFRLARTF